jgi:ribosomal protein S26
MISTPDGLKQHRRNCEKRSIKKIVNNAIECKECGKVCPNFQSFKIHSMFHQSTITADTSIKKTEKGKKTQFICDTCGREFKASQNLREHKKRMHSM